jgi:CheY-like chemotaxis protein
VKGSFPFLREEEAFTDIGTVRDDLRILIVEDNKMNQKVMGALLETLGYKYDVTEDGYEGFLQAKLVKYDIIFMDLIMPEMDGYESAQKILQHDKSNLIVAFTADSMPESRKKAEMAGIRDFISKPVRIEELKKLFSKYFRM